MVQRRFLYGFLSQSSDAYNLTIPWQPSVQDGLFKMNYDIVSATQDDLKMWANTNWGERPMKFRFGLDARRYLFEDINTAKNNIKENAYSQLALYFAYIKIINLNILTFEDDSSLGLNSIRFIFEGQIQSDPYRTIALNEVVSA